MRLTALIALLLVSALPSHAQQLADTRRNLEHDPALPDAPSFLLTASVAPEVRAPYTPSPGFTLLPDSGPQDTGPRPGPQRPVDLDSDGNPVPLNHQQPRRILGFIPNFRSVSVGSKPHPPGWKYNFKIATRQAFDYSSFVFLGLTSISAEGLDEHRSLGKGVRGFYSYTWRGFLDKTDGTYLGGWFLPSLLHEDTRFYPLGDSHRVFTRALYVISRQGVARTYSGRNIPNVAGLGGKVLTQVVSRQYYPAGSTTFGVLAEKFAYAAMRDIAISSIREFYPDVAAHYIRKHREKMARLASQSAGAAPAQP